MAQGMRFTGGANVNPTIEMDDVTYVIPLATPGAYVTNKCNSRVVKTAAATLTADESGALCIFNAAAGFTYTLPAAVTGLWFEFLVTVTATSSVHRIACATGDFLLGAILQSPDSTDAVARRAADGTADLAWEGNGTTTGGYIGDWVRVTAISGTQWVIQGLNTATGTEATPIKTT